MFHFWIFCFFTIVSVLPIPTPFHYGALSLSIIGFIRFILFTKRIAKQQLTEEEELKAKNIHVYPYFDAEYIGDLLQTSPSIPSILFFRELKTNQDFSKFTFDVNMIHRAKRHRKIRIYYGDTYIVAILPITVDETSDL